MQVALRKFKWKDCQNPPNTKVASIVDQELFRDNIVFVIGRNGKLYQYNKVTELWHEHYQSQHLILSRLPGTAMRASSQSLTGSLFMLSEDGGLVEYHWNTGVGWNWIEHGTPNKGVTLITSPSPCFEGNQLFLIGSDGKVYVRYMDKMTWRWKNCGFPYLGKLMDEDQTQEGGNDDNEEVCMDKDFAASLENVAEKYSDYNRNCDPKVGIRIFSSFFFFLIHILTGCWTALEINDECFEHSQVAPTRPIPFSDDSVIFELRDRRVRNTCSFTVSDFY